ncbi:MAG: hypothetical protein ACLSB9_36445 [Hydrogeniiclostridium mannosilyticum]
MEAKVKWYECSGGTENDVVVSTRLLLSRNIEGFPFCGRMRASTAKRHCRRLCRQWRMKTPCWPMRFPLYRCADF